jgi:uncharacterized protein YkwD
MAQVENLPQRLEWFRRSQALRKSGKAARSQEFYQRAARLPDWTPAVQRAALGRLNEYRYFAMLMPVMPHRQVVRAAKVHAEYLRRHTHTRALSLKQAHGETPGHPGFTGATSGERLSHQGLRGSSTEAVTSEVDPEGAVDILMNSVYHRSGLLRQEARYAGFAASTQAVLDLFWEKDAKDEMELVIYPGPGQTGVPPRFPGGETPDPLPGQEYPVGSPLSVGGSGAAPEVLSYELRGPGGRIPLRLLTARNAPRGSLLGDYSYLMPLKPLGSEQEYRAYLRVRVGQEVRRLHWSFRTGTQVPGEQYARIVNLVMNKQTPAPGRPMDFHVEVKASHPRELQLRWSVDDLPQQDGAGHDFRWKALAGSHRIQIDAYYPDRPEAFMRKMFTVFVPAKGVKQGRPPREFNLDPPPPWRAGTAVTLEATPPPGTTGASYRFFVDGKPIAVTQGERGRAHWRADGKPSHKFRVEVAFSGGKLTRFLEVARR